MTSRASQCRVRQVIRAESASAEAPRPAVEKERRNVGAIGRVLKTLHDTTTAEPLPPGLAALLRRLEASERWGGR